MPRTWSPLLPSGSAFASLPNCSGGEQIIVLHPLDEWCLTDRYLLARWAKEALIAQQLERKRQIESQLTSAQRRKLRRLTAPTSSPSAPASGSAPTSPKASDSSFPPLTPTSS